jgi:hypothetical protein
MKKTAILVNISRGKVVDEAALTRALAEGRIMGAGLDALAEEPLPAASPLWDLPNVLITPHVGGQGGHQLWRRMSELIRDNTRRYLLGAPLKHSSEPPTERCTVFDRHWSETPSARSPEAKMRRLQNPYSLLLHGGASQLYDSMCRLGANV